ncbi:MAG: hypothetical protein KFF72_04640 [Arthrospira sp. SH-MAG29]|nr:hypothetical protein [Arthrospira sp. SH-MAG29]MBS0015645.1 hypothetical protein [Arthrospira sp. SH-MAG29]
MKIITPLVGLALVLLGIYFLGQNIIVATRLSLNLFGSMSTAGSVLLMVSGLVALISFPRETGNLGWILLLLGIILVFLHARIILRPSSLLTLLLSISSILVGCNLLKTRTTRF